jgi:hypothetical protein
MISNQTLVAASNTLKKLTFSLCLLCVFSASAQVGVGTQTPATTLDVVGAAGNTPGALNTIDGIAVPIVTDDMTTTSTNGSKISQLVYSNNAASTGFYFWDGSAWTAMSGGSKTTDWTSTGAPLQLNGAGGTATMVGDTTNNVVEVTTAAFGAATQLTLPDATTNAGRIILVANGPGGAAVQVTNAYSPSGAIAANSVRAYYSNGVTWFGTE